MCQLFMLSYKYDMTAHLVVESRYQRYRYFSPLYQRCVQSYFFSPDLHYSATISYPFHDQMDGIYIDSKKFLSKIGIRWVQFFTILYLDRASKWEPSFSLVTSMEPKKEPDLTLCNHYILLINSGLHRIELTELN